MVDFAKKRTHMRKLSGGLEVPVLAPRAQSTEPNVVWEAYPDTSQEAALDCPYFELLYEGTRGPGKTDFLLMDFAQHVGEGFGRFWRGVLFRKQFPDLSEVIEKSMRLFPLIFPDAQYNQGTHTWRFATGESLVFAHIKNLKEYSNYHGHEYPWIGWDELGTYASPELYDLMKSCCRSSYTGVGTHGNKMPRKYRATANPYGPGHNWLKKRFVDPGEPGTPIKDKQGNVRVRVHGHWSENKNLLEADPEYIQRLMADRNEHRKKAWIDGSWDVVAGGMFDDVWDRAKHMRKGWPVEKTPSSWKLYRSYDHGSSKPFSYGLWAKTDGTDAPDGKQYYPGSWIRVAEWYGWDGENPNVGVKMSARDIARGIKALETKLGVFERVQPGAADSAIYSAEPGHRSTAQDMEVEGVFFTPSVKKPGSRKTGWNIMRTYLTAALEGREEPGLYVFENCTDGFLRTVPVLSRDDDDPDDVDTETEDHCADEARYQLTAELTEAREVDARELY